MRHPVFVATMLFGGVLLASEGRSSETSSPSAARQLAEAVQLEIDAGLFPGAVVLVGTPEGVVYHEAFGFSQIEPVNVAMQRDSLFDMASITKVVTTSTACAMLVDEGKLDPDAPVTDYLQDHVGKGVEKISLRRLASHTSGFPEHPRLGERGQGAEMFAAMLSESPSWQCNSRYQYACRNAIILSTVVEQVSGQSFSDFCRERLFEPLNMVDTQFNRVEALDRAAASHSPTLGASSNIDVRAAGRAIGNAGLFSTARDLANFCEMMLGNGKWQGRRLLSNRVIADFTKLNQLPQFPGRGFLWEVDVDSIHRPTRLSAKAYGHSGYTGQSLWIDPVQKVYLVILTNRTAIPDHGSKKEQQYRARSRIGDMALAVLVSDSH
jgi:CubicO group peptidase (beta-lactamase class C family)